MVDGADCVCRFPDEALVGVAQAPSPEGVLVTVQHEGVICYDALLKVNTRKGLGIVQSRATLPSTV